MNEQNIDSKCQQLEQQQKEDNDNGPIGGVNNEWSLNLADENSTTSNNGNAMTELKLKIAALESKNALLEAKVEMLVEKLDKQQELNAKMHLLAEELQKVKVENKALGEKLKEAEQKAQMAKNEMEEFSMTSGQKEKQETISKNQMKPENSQKSLVRQRIPLPLELNCQIFECLKFESQRKFIGGLGRGIYGIFRHKVLKKSKRLRNPKQNGWKVSSTNAMISSKGLLAGNKTGFWLNVFAKKGFPIIGEQFRTDNFPGTILYYFEVTIVSMSTYNGHIFLSLSSGNIPANGSFVGVEPNSFSIQETRDYCWLFPNLHDFEWPNGAIWNGKGDVYGCGLLLNPENKLSIFFTVNGFLMGKKKPINATVITLYPTLSILGRCAVEANFGDDSAKPFKYNIEKCPGMVFK